MNIWEALKTAPLRPSLLVGRSRRARATGPDGSYYVAWKTVGPIKINRFLNGNRTLVEMDDVADLNWEPIT